MGIVNVIHTFISSPRIIDLISFWLTNSNKLHFLYRTAKGWSLNLFGCPKKKDNPYLVVNLATTKQSTT